MFLTCHKCSGTVSSEALECLHCGTQDFCPTLLTKTAADRFLRDHGAVNLSYFTLAQTAAAKALAQHRKPLLNLDGLTTLSDSVAEALARKGGTLNLSGLTALKDSTARALARHRGFLNLNGLKTITDSVARELAQHQGPHLILDGITTLTEESA